MADFNYEEEKQRVEKILKDDKFDIEVMKNDDVDYAENIEEDFTAFEKQMDSDESKILRSMVFGK